MAEPRTEGQRLLREIPDSLRVIAEKLGCSKPLVSQWRSGKKEPGSRFIKALHTEYGIPIDAWTRKAGSAAETPRSAAETLQSAPAAPIAPEPEPQLEPEPEPELEPEEPPSAPRRRSKKLPQTLEHINELLEKVRSERELPDIDHRTRAKLIDQESKLIAVKARLERDQELLEDRVIRKHPTWKKARSALLRVLRPHPQIAEDVIEALEAVGL